MTSFHTTSALSANEGALPCQPRSGTCACAPCTCDGCGQQCAHGEAAMQAGSPTGARCQCAACTCAICNCA
jgi:hypothetical protein